MNIKYIQATINHIDEYSDLELFNILDACKMKQARMIERSWIRPIKEGSADYKIADKLDALVSLIEKKLLIKK